MEINRNQYFMFGVVILLLGIQLKVVDSYVLNEPATQFVEKRMKKSESAELNMPTMTINTATPQGRHTWTPPKWIGWAMLSVGAVLVLHSLAMRRPG